MKALLLIIGSIGTIVGALSLLYAALNWFGYYNLMDGEGDIYKKLHHKMVVSFILGIALAVVGVVCLFMRSMM